MREIKNQIQTRNGKEDIDKEPAASRFVFFVLTLRLNLDF